MLLLKDHHQHVNRLMRAALLAADPEAAVRRYLQLDRSTLTAGEAHFELHENKVFLVAVGKAATAMGQTAAGILGSQLYQGIIITKHLSEAPDPADRAEPEEDSYPFPLSYYEAGHPISDERSIRATAEVIRLMHQTKPGDIVLCLISGGASSLFTQPVISLSAWRSLVDALLMSGCTINELNVVRRQLDRVKGGGLAKIAAPARCLALILSDVIGNPLEVIGSGPTVQDFASTIEAKEVLSRYDIQSKIEVDTWLEIEEHFANREEKTAGDTPTAVNIIIGDVRTAAKAAVREAIAQGFSAQLLTAQYEGEAREVGRVAAAILKDMNGGCCLILGGESTVTVRGQGVGGRNLELALSAAISLENEPGVCLATFATDGDDGPTDAAGAVVTGQTVAKARRLNLDPLAHLDKNDSYHFFQKVNSLLITGSTGTNVNDLIFLLRYNH